MGTPGPPGGVTARPLRGPAPQAAVPAPGPRGAPLQAPRPLADRLPSGRASAALGQGKMVEVSGCLCPHRASARAARPGEEALARLQPAGSPYLISPHSPTNLASPARRAGFAGPSNVSARRANPWDPSPRRSPEPWPRLPPRARQAGAPGLRTPRLNVGAGTCGEDQGQAPGGRMLSTGSSGPASNRWGEAGSPAVEQQASQLHPPLKKKPTLPTEHAQLT